MGCPHTEAAPAKQVEVVGWVFISVLPLLPVSGDAFLWDPCWGMKHFDLFVDFKSSSLGNTKTIVFKFTGVKCCCLLKTIFATGANRAENMKIREERDQNRGALKVTDNLWR